MSSTLVDLLSNALVFRQTAPYLSITSIAALQATCKSLQGIINTSPDVFRYLDLSTRDMYESIAVRDCCTRRTNQLSIGDWWMTLPAIISILQEKNVMQHVRTLILDGLIVPTNVFGHILEDDGFHLRILSIREARQLNYDKLPQILDWCGRPSRPAGTPQLKGLYVFGSKNMPLRNMSSHTETIKDRRGIEGVTAADGAQLGVKWNEKSRHALSISLPDTKEIWYQSLGYALAIKPKQEWAETLRACAGVIFFDAVLCRGPRHDPSVTSEDGYLYPAIATVALGPAGCVVCGSCPESPAVFGLSPASLHGSASPPFIARCTACLSDRWCNNCNIWWCEDCYKPVSPRRAKSMTEPQLVQLGMQSVTDEQLPMNASVKVHMGLCVENCLVPEMMAGAGSAGMWG
jgi:hypothetical protein